MALKQDRQGGAGREPAQIRKEKEQQVMVEEPFLKPNEVRVVLTYLRQGKEVSESIVVPKSLVIALADPGESGMKPLEAMKELAEFNEKIIRPELRGLIINGGVSVPAAILSAQIQYSYATHAVVAATTKNVSDSLMLEHPEVSKILRTTAALLCGVSTEEIQRLDLNETTVWVGRTLTEIKRTPEIKMTVTRLECDCGSHAEVREFTVPEGTSVSEARSIQEQRLKRLPDVKRELDRAYEKIEELRGKQLTNDEKNVVVAYMNITYIKDAKNRLVVTP
ncbi:MAG: hypothetical protein QXT45_06470 [Candidatus Bilamarchaeaceae archaeon]